MRNRKFKLMTAILAATMTISVAAPYAVIADEKVTVNDKDTEDKYTPKTHTFTAYQIFSGTYSEGTLTDLKWSTVINAEKFYESLQEDTELNKYLKLSATLDEGVKYTDDAVAQTVAKALGKLTETEGDTDDEKAEDQAAKEALALKIGVYAANSLKSGATGTEIKGTDTTVKIDNGYYVIVDTTSSSDIQKGDAYNLPLLQVTDGNLTIAQKTDVPTLDKKVKENKETVTDKKKEFNTEDSGTEMYNDVADYSIGDTIDYELIGYIPDLTHYDSYYYTFTDTKTDGLTYVDAATTETDKTEKLAFKAYLSSDKIQDKEDTEITSWFTATYGTGKKSFDVKDEDLLNNKLGEKTVTKTDLENKYIIIQYQAVLNENAKIGAAEGNPNTAKLSYSNKPGYTSDGKENTGETPEDKAIVFTYEMDVTKVDGDSKDEDGKYEKMLKDAKFILYREVSDGTTTTKEYAVVNTTTNKVEKFVTDEEKATKLVSAETTGLFKVIGLDQGTYQLKETDAPSGYNKLTSPITIEIEADTQNNQDWSGVVGDAIKADSLKVTYDGTTNKGTLSTGVVEVIVENNKGSLLPETGGIGTQLFYVFGSLLAAASAALLVMRRKKNSIEA